MTRWRLCTRSRGRGGGSCGHAGRWWSRSPARRARPRRRTSSRRCSAAACAWRPARRTSTPRSGCRLPCWAHLGETELLVLEMAMRGPGQIAQLTAIAEPDVGVIVNVGPAHLELLGSLEAIAAAKAELIAGLAPGASVVVPAGEPLLAPHLRADVHVVTFGDGGEVWLAERRADGAVLIRDGEAEIELWPSFAQAYNLRNLLAAVAAARALGYTPRGRVDVRFSAMRGQREELPGGVALIERLLQRQPDVHARGDRRPGRDGSRQARGGARRHARARARRGAPASRDRRARRRQGRRAARHGRPAGGRDAAGIRRREPLRRPTRGRLPSCSERCCARATRCS